ncbi:MAG: PAS domain-containing sensor histidine kinase, partial [bacterium]
RRLEEDIVQTTKKIIDLVKPLSRNKSITSWNTGIAIAGFTSLKQTINQYIEEDRQEVRSALEKLHQFRSRATRRMLIIGISMLISLSLYSWFVYRSIIGPVKSIRSSIRSVANEDFDQPVEYDRDDELGEIARDFNIMVEKLNEAWDTMEEKVDEKTQQLLLREKLSTVGEMASRMAHELNTPLATIGTAAEGIEKRVDEEDEQVHEYAQIMKTESIHCKEILDRFLEMARSPSEERRSVRLDELCRDTLSMLKFLPEFEEANIEVAVDLEPAVVEGSVSLLRQVIFNLLKNGMKSVLSEEARNDQPRLDIELITDDDIVRFVVEDNGKGFDPSDKEEFFEPFVTSYAGDEGVGLGLSISRQIIDEHEGDLDLESDGPGEGCRAYFELPLKEVES